MLNINIMTNILHKRHNNINTGIAPWDSGSEIEEFLVRKEKSKNASIHKIVCVKKIYLDRPCNCETKAFGELKTPMMYRLRLARLMKSIYSHNQLEKTLKTRPANRYSSSIKY